MTLLLASLLLSSYGSSAPAKSALQGFAAERKAGHADEEALSRLFSEGVSTQKLEEPSASVKMTRAALPKLTAEVRRQVPLETSPVSVPPAEALRTDVPFTEGLYRSELDKVSVLAALGYLKVGVMQGGAVAIYGFGSLGQVSGWAGGPRGQLNSVLNSAVAQGVLASVAAAVVDHSRYSPHR